MQMGKEGRREIVRSRTGERWREETWTEKTGVHMVTRFPFNFPQRLIDLLSPPMISFKGPNYKTPN